MGDVSHLFPALVLCLTWTCRPVGCRSNYGSSRHSGYPQIPGYLSPSVPEVKKPSQIWPVVPVFLQLPTVETTLPTTPVTYPQDFPYSVQPPELCRSTTARANLDCPCLLLGLPCLPPNSLCVRDPNGDGYCGCAFGYVYLNATCVTYQYYVQNVLRPFVISPPAIIASCFLPANAVIGNLPKTGGTRITSYNLTLVFSSPLGDTAKYISIDQANGNILFLRAPQASMLNQTYQVITRDVSGNYSTRTFTVAYNCTPPTCSIDVGNNIFVDCQVSSVGSAIGSVLASGSVAPNRFNMTLISSTSTLGNTYYTLDPITGIISVSKALHGGIFIENYNVTARNGVGQFCTPVQLRITTSSDCT